MNPATAAALTIALVWSDVPDVMLVKAQADSNQISRLEINIVSMRASRKQSYIYLTCEHN